MAKILTRIDLMSTVRPTRAIFLEHVAVHIISWLKQLPSFIKPALSLDKTVREMICKALFSPLLLSYSPDQDFEATFELFSIADQFENVREHYRMDILLTYESRLWKEPRQFIKELFISTVVLMQDYKLPTALRLAKCYFALLHSYVYDDDESDLSIMTFTVQFFTVPTIAKFLIDNTNLVESLLIYCKAFYVEDDEFDLDDALMKGFAEARDNHSIQTNRIELASDSARNPKASHVFQDLAYLLTAYHSKESSGNIWIHERFQESLSPFVRVLEMCCVWQGMTPIVRSVGEHVPYEDENWASAFNLSFRVNGILQKITNSVLNSSDDAPLIYMIEQTRHYLFKWTSMDHDLQTAALAEALQTSVQGFKNLEIVKGKQISVPDHRIGLSMVSVHNPLHWVYAYLLKAALCHDSTEQLTQVCFPQMVEGSPLSTSALLLLFDYTFQTFAFVAQVHAKLWVRNGTVAHGQAFNYTSFLSECYYNDLFLLQMAVCTLGPDPFLSSFIDRIGVYTWAACGLLPEAIDHTSIIALAKSFSLYLIYTLSERHWITNTSLTEQLQKEIIHHLAAQENGLPYSELERKISSYLIKEDRSELDKLLPLYADFKSPGLSDRGIYTLKDQFYDMIDPWFYRYSPNQCETVETILKKKNNRKDYSGRKVTTMPIIKPGFNRLDKLVDSVIFNQVLFYSISPLVEVLLSDEANPLANDALLGQAIHLIVLGCEIIELNDNISPSESDFLVNLSTVRLKLNLDPYRPTTVLELLLALIDRANDDKVKEYAHILRFLVRKIESLGSDLVKHVISGWRDKSRWDLQGRAAQSIESTEIDAKTLRDAAKARKDAIKAQFLQAQRSFVANFGDDMEASDDEDVNMDTSPTNGQERKSERVWSFPTGTCIVCQEETKTEKKFCMPFMITKVNNIQKFDFSQFPAWVPDLGTDWDSGQRSEEFGKRNLVQVEMHPLYVLQAVDI